MNLPLSSRVDVQFLNRLFDNTSECYKFFWFHAILQKVREEKQTSSFEELVDSMIAEAWYMVTEYHLNDQDIRYRLYRQGLREDEFMSELTSVMMPVYQSAHNAGFREWIYR